MALSDRDEIENAKSAAMRAALAMGHNSRGMAAELMRAAEIKVLRTIVSAMMKGGEAGYWAAVETELRK